MGAETTNDVTDTKRDADARVEVRLDSPTDAMNAIEERDRDDVPKTDEPSH